MDKGKVVRLILIPIIIGLVVTLIVRQVLAPSQETAAGGPELEMTSVVVVGTKEPIPARTRVAEQQFVLKQVPKSILTGSEFVAVKDVAGQITEVQLQPGEVVLKSRVVPEGKGSMAYKVPQGMRAITIRIDELSGVAGNANVGDLVDLVLVLQASKPDRPFASSRLIYEGVQILGKGLATGTIDGNAKAAPADLQKLTSLTLAMKPEHAVEVALAEQIGLIKVMLRPAENKEGDRGRLQFNEQSYK